MYVFLGQKPSAAVQSSPLGDMERSIQGFVQNGGAKPRVWGAGRRPGQHSPGKGKRKPEKNNDCVGKA